MATDQQARDAAIATGAKCYPFSQSAGNCAGMAAWWVRSRFKGKNFWSSRSFGRIHELALYPEETFTGFFETTRGMEKATRLQDAFFGNDQHRNYITRPERPAKQTRSFNGPGRYVESVSAKSISSVTQYATENAVLIRKEFERVAQNCWAATFSIRTFKGRAHAVGLDALDSPSVHYFDPNLGEFVFGSSDDFCSWWCSMYAYRAIPARQGAFGLMGDSFNADYFSR